MTEEYPEINPDEYQFPDKYFRKLREYDGEHGGLFSVVQGGLYRALANDREPNFTEKDAMQVSRLLNNREIDEAEDFVYDRLDADK